MSPGSLRRWHRREGGSAEREVELARPASRGDCRSLPRPCPFVGCRHHLYLDVKPSGAITVAWPHLEAWEIPETCSLDVAECGSHTLDEVGDLLNVSCEQVRKIEERALHLLRSRHGRDLAKLLPENGGGCRSEPAQPTVASDVGPVLAEAGQPRLEPGDSAPPRMEVG
ncbi:MAG: sigma factor-like helix-turn-helix DNA-binding protein [Polyangia bacterium]|nr:sigma factor-like helix-turn-helix DNA-binding protein [Polyangia bacterium]